ncbi:MAG TPA: LysE family translocator [Rickettsiales bacterium]|nr:LysE family translocator [Rickettsiales bacterium]
MIPLHAYLLYCGLYAIAIAVPGPGIVAIVARALRSGFRSAIPAVLGNAVGDWILMSLSALGLAVLAQSMGKLFLIVRLAGAVYLFYLGYKYWTAEAADATDAPPADARQGFLSQLALTLGNPKAIAFFVALLPVAVDINHLKPAGYFQLSATTFVLLPAIMLSYAALAARIRQFLSSRKAQNRLNKTAAVIMVGTGIGVAAT